MHDWGPFFAVHAHRADATPTPPWRPFRELLDEPGRLAERVSAIQAYLAAGGGRPARRVAESVTQLGLVARLVSPTLAMAVSTGEFPALELDDVWWQPELGGTFPLSAHYRDGGSADALVDGPLWTLTSAFAGSDKVLSGNVASAINGAATMIATARPDLAARAHALADELLATPRLRATSVRGPDGRFRRRSCCLIYLAAPTPSRAAVCGDCVLVR
ncbi:MAG TPA: (2Fe-2S)-binding protein [Pseudonocardiaceae bacterium]|nr:(2Fe-2S)-binding protein [Pseudonocardiaceae bacterium]